jgi:hypothetical protein
MATRNSTKATPPGEAEALVILNARVPISLHQQLARAAKESFRRMRSEVNVRLRESLRSLEQAT